MAESCVCMDEEIAALCLGTEFVEWITLKASNKSSRMKPQPCLRPRTFTEAWSHTLCFWLSCCLIWKSLALEADMSWKSCQFVLLWLTIDWLLQVIFSWTASYLEHSSVELSIPDSQSGISKVLQVAMLCNQILGGLICHNQVPGVTSAED